MCSGSLSWELTASSLNGCLALILEGSHVQKLQIALFSDSSFNFPISSKESQLLAFMTFQVLTVSPIPPALKQPGRNLLKWLAAGVFAQVLKF